MLKIITRREQQLVIFDEEENPQAIPQSHAFPLATQKVHVGGPALPVAPPFGFLALDLWHHTAWMLTRPYLYELKRERT